MHACVRATVSGGPTELAMQRRSVYGHRQRSNVHKLWVVLAMIVTNGGAVWAAISGDGIDADRHSHACIPRPSTTRASSWHEGLARKARGVQ